MSPPRASALAAAAALLVAAAAFSPAGADENRPGGSGGTGNQSGRERSGDSDGDGYNDQDMTSYRAMLDRHAASRCYGSGCNGNFSERERREINAAASDLARQRAADRWDTGGRNGSLARIPDGPSAAGLRSGQGFGAAFGGAPCCKKAAAEAD